VDLADEGQHGTGVDRTTFRTTAGGEIRSNGFAGNVNATRTVGDPTTEGWTATVDAQVQGDENGVTGRVDAQGTRRTVDEETATVRETGGTAHAEVNPTGV